MKNMNRKQKIIVSITGIFLVLLILVGLTYAYFLTKINGNTNAKSISVTTADLKLTYGDGNGIIAPTSKLLPGTTLQSKTFTVTNEGDSKTEYGVIFDKVFNELSRQQDLVYTLSCTSTIGNCNGVTNETIFPNGGGTKDNGTGYGIAVTNSIEKNAVHTYTLVVKYLEPNVDQSEDMGKTIQARVNIADMRSLNPYSADTTNTIAKAVVNNAITLTSAQKAKGYAEFLATPKTVPAKVATTSNESSLSMTTDDYGITYYYRGAVNNNYVNFAGMCWRIVRIAGDGSTKLILDDKNTTCNSSSYNQDWSIGQTAYGYNSDGSIKYGKHDSDTATINIGSYDNSEVKALKTNLADWYNSKMKTYESKLKSENVCLGDTETKYNSSSNLTEYSYDFSYNAKYYEYDVYNRIKNGNATLRCNGKKAESAYVYPITADEVAYAGGKDNSVSSYYLTSYYQTSFWTASVALYSEMSFNHPSMVAGDAAYRVGMDGVLVAGEYKGVTLQGAVSESRISTDSFYSNIIRFAARPMVTLKKGTVLSSGDGSKKTPYVVS